MIRRRPTPSHGAATVRTDQVALDLRWSVVWKAPSEQREADRKDQPDDHGKQQSQQDLVLVEPHKNVDDERDDEADEEVVPEATECCPHAGGVFPSDGPV